MPAPASLFIRGARFNGANARATNARVEFPHSQSGRPTDIHASTTNPLPKSRDPGQAGSSGAANRARKNQEVRDLREQLAAVAQEAVLLREQNATLTFSLGCSERRVAGLVTLTSQLYISYGDSSTGKSVAELSLAAKSAEVVRLTDDLAALAQAHEALKGHIAASETSATQRIAAKDRDIADLQARQSSAAAAPARLSGCVAPLSLLRMTAMPLAAADAAEAPVAATAAAGAAFSPP